MDEAKTVAGNKRKRVSFHAGTQKGSDDASTCTISFRDQEMKRFPMCGAILECDQSDEHSVWKSCDMSFEQVVEALTVLRIMDKAPDILWSAVRMMPVVRLSKWLQDMEFERLMRSIRATCFAVIRVLLDPDSQDTSRVPEEEGDEWIMDRIELFITLAEMDFIYHVPLPKRISPATYTLLTRLVALQPRMICEFMARLRHSWVVGAGPLPFVTESEQSFLKTHPMFQPPPGLIWTVASLSNTIRIHNSSDLVHVLQSCFSADAHVVKYRFDSHDLFLMMDVRTRLHMYVWTDIPRERARDCGGRWPHTAVGVGMCIRQTKYMCLLENDREETMHKRAKWILQTLQWNVSVEVMHVDRMANSLRLSAKKFHTTMESLDNEYPHFTPLPTTLPIRDGMTPKEVIQTLSRFLMVLPNRICLLRDLTGTSPTSEFAVPPGLDDFATFLYATPDGRKTFKTFASWTY